jgi:hypothetical protein
MSLTDDAEDIHPNLKLLSHSSNKELHGCGRKYELYKLLPSSNWLYDLHPVADGEELSNLFEQEVHLDFGSLVGIGTQKYLEAGNLNHAKYEAFRHCHVDIEDTDGEKDKKTFWHVLYAIEKFSTFKQMALNQYELVYIDGKPATELGFVIDCGDGFSYRGFLDALLFDRRNQVILPYEGKTTKYRNIHESVYKHSSQALGYSLVLDTVVRLLGLSVQSSFEVLYSIYKSASFEWELMRFEKNFTQRAMWIKNLLMDKALIQFYAQQNYFPMHGEHCYSFFKPCEYFGTCEMSNSTLLGGKDAMIRKDDMSRYQFHFKLEDIIAAQLEGVE